MRNKLLQNDFKIKPPTTWLGKLFERLKRFFTLSHQWVSTRVLLKPTGDENKGQDEASRIKFKNAQGNKLSNGLTTDLPDHSNGIKDSQKQANRQIQHPNSAFWQGNRQQPVNGADKPRLRGGRIK